MQTTTIRLAASNIADVGGSPSSPGPGESLEPPEPPDISARHTHPREFYSDSPKASAAAFALRGVGGRGQGLHQHGLPYNVPGAVDSSGLTSFSQSAVSSLCSYSQASTSTTSIPLHARDTDAIALRPMSPASSLSDDQRKHLLLADEDERTPSRNYGGIVYAGDLESSAATPTRQPRLKAVKSDKSPAELDENNRLHYTKQDHFAPPRDCSASPLYGESNESPTPSELEAGLVQDRFKMAFTRVEMLVHLLAMGVVTLLIVLSMWLTIARVKM